MKEPTLKRNSTGYAMCLKTCKIFARYEELYVFVMNILRLAFDPNHRSTAAECLQILEKPGRNFDVVSHFIDSFCFSGSHVFHAPEPKEFKQHSKKNWLYVPKFPREGALEGKYKSRVAEANQRLQDYKLYMSRIPPDPAVTAEDRQSIEGALQEVKMRLEKTLNSQKKNPFQNMSEACKAPEFCVFPPPSSTLPRDTRRRIFLPLNKFCSDFGHHEDTGMFDAEALEFIDQGAWFTVFRYTTPSGQRMIIKHTNVNNATFKYLLQEKAMLSYLRCKKFIAGEVSDFSFTPIVAFQVEGVVQTDRFIVYEDAGCPLKQVIADGLVPDVKDVMEFTKCLLEALDFLRKSNVVHRNIHMNSVIWDKSAAHVKMVALGHARYVGPLPFDRRMQEFLENFRPPAPVAFARQPFPRSVWEAQDHCDLQCSADFPPHPPSARSQQVNLDCNDHVDSDDGVPSVGEMDSSQAQCVCIFKHMRSLSNDVMPQVQTTHV